MSGTKRKNVITPGIQQKGSTKKQKTAPGSAPKPQLRAPDLETATDSDPIVESDTTEHSGDDDGASWPADEDAEDEVSKDDVPNEDAEKEVSSDDGPDEGVPLPGHKPQKVGKTGALATESSGNQSSSKEAHAKQKALAQERKAGKPNADSIARTKKLWERLRRKSHVPKDERKKLVGELFEIITGNVKDFVLKHDSVRVIQTAIKYANLDQRRNIARELKGEYRSLAESRYAKFLLGKLLVHGDKQIRDLIVPEFYGHVRRLIKHPEAAWILDDVYRGVATPSQKSILLREWYGAEFAIFKSQGQDPVSGELKSILKEHPEKRKPIMHALHDLINLLVQKKTTGFTMLHDAMLQYLLNISTGTEEMTNFIELLKGDEEGDLLKNLAFTRSGARVVCLALAYGNAKDRKQMLKVYKGTIQAMANDASGHQVILTAYDVIDDTVLTSKFIFPELIGKSSDLDENQKQSLLDAVNNIVARIPILYLFTGESRMLLRDEDMEMLHEVHSIRNTTSKKDPATRRKELLAYVSPILLSMIVENAEALVRSSFGCQFITEVMLSAVGDREEALEQIAELTKADTPEIKQALNEPSAGRMLKTLVQGGRYNPKSKSVELVEPALDFHNSLFASLHEQGRVLEWATGGNSFVIVGFLEADGFENKESLMEILKNGRKELEEAAAPKTPEKVETKNSGEHAAAAKTSKKVGTTGDEVKVAALKISKEVGTQRSGEKAAPAKASKKGESGKNGEKTRLGNRGAQLLLEKLDDA
ncbi:MAG: hypothetical protein LQ346_005439 [Caloplaca aetnensis]|nr:MAG: hypothetical protein LQ346_005439 [Caloplaca aetnensis]